MSFDPRGRVVVFLGPDGAGKSTVLNLVKDRLTESGADFHSYYFAPGFLARYRPKGDNAVTTNPHDGRQYGAGLIVAKIALMLFEFRMGVRKVRKKHDIVLFDRFIHDLLVDPKRYRMERLRWWMRAMLGLAPKPDLLIVISAPAEVIHGRKQEVPFEETKRQVEAYKALATGFANALVIENTGTPEQAAEAALARLKSL